MKYFLVEKEIRFSDSDSVMVVRAYTSSGDCIGDENLAIHLSKYGIEPEIREDGDDFCSIGFSEKDQKWYGWSNRAFFGFRIGSRVKKGGLAYIAPTPEEMIEDIVHFRSSETEEDYVRRELMVAKENGKDLITTEEQIRSDLLRRRKYLWIDDDREGIYQMVDYDSNIVFINSVDDKIFEGRSVRDIVAGAKDRKILLDMHDMYGFFVTYTPVGRGEWTARTLDDAKQMAMDFAANAY